MSWRSRRFATAILAILTAATLPAPVSAQTIVSATGYAITFNGNQQAFFSNTWDGTSQQSPSNIALSSQGSTAFASSQLGSGHLTSQANDGIYGNNRSWLSNQTGTQASIGIAFPTAQSLSSIAWGRDNGRNSTATPTGGGDTVGGTAGQFTDRVAGPYTIQFTTAANPNASTPDSSWTTLGTISLADSGAFLSYYRHEFNVATSAGAPITGVTGIRFLVGPTLILDEIEVYRTGYWTGGSAVWSSTTAWQTASSGGTSTTPFAGDSLAFAQATATTQAVTLGAADRTTRALSFTTTDAVNLTAGGTNRTLTLGWVGDLTTSSTAAISTLTVGSSAGPVTIGSPATGDQVAVALNASQTWTNDSTNTVTVLNGISRVSSDSTSRVLAITGSGNTAIGGVIANGGSAGTLGLTKSGSGVLTLSAANSYTGLTTVSAGSLALNSAGSTLTTGSVNLAGSGATFDISAASGDRTIGMLTGSAGSVFALGNRTLTVGDATSGTFAGGFGGTGGLTKVGSGLLTLSGSSSYSGTTSINAGTLRMANANALGTGTISFAGGTLQYSGITTDVSGRLSTAESQPYNVDTNGNAVTWGTALTSSGGTLTKSGAGTLSLSASNSYTGITTVSAGVLALSSAGNLPTTGTVALTGSGATFDISAASGNRTIGMLTGSAGSAVALGARVLGVGDATSGTFGGVINGTGGLSKAGSGRLTLSASNGYTGGTTIAAGTLALSGSGSIATTGNVTLAASGATFDISEAANNITVGALTGTAGSAITLGSRTLTVQSGNDTTFSGVISGSGGLTQNGFILRLNAQQSYTGTTSITSGYITLNVANTLSPQSVVTMSAGFLDISNLPQAIAGLSGSNGTVYGFGSGGVFTLNVASGTSFSYGGQLGGGSPNFSIVKSGFGTQILTGSNTYTRGTTLSSGTLGFAANSLASSGTVALNGGTLRWEAGNTQDISSRLTIGSGSAATIDVGTNDVTFAGTFGGGSTGSLTKLGAGRLTLTGTAGYTGGTTIAAGTLQVGNGGTAGAMTGNIVNNGVLLLNRSDTVVLAGAISGAGGITIASTGSGSTARVVFDSAAKSYLGPTVINAGGDLRVNSDNSLATGAVTVNGRLGGSGNLGGAVTVNSGGVLAPGNSIESLSMGALSFADGATYEYEIDSSALLSVGADFTKALGSLSLAGTVDLSISDLAGSPTAFAPGTTFSLVNYTGSWNNGLFTVGGTQVADGDTFTAGLNTWQLDYNASSGGSNYSDDYTTGSFVNIVAVPEPGAIALASIGIAAAAIAFRRRK